MLLLDASCPPSLPLSVAQLAAKAGVSVGSIKNVVVWGNHSDTQYPDLTHATIEKDGQTLKASAVVPADWVQDKFIDTVQALDARARRPSTPADPAPCPAPTSARFDDVDLVRRALLSLRGEDGGRADDAVQVDVVAARHAGQVQLTVLLL